MGIGGMVELQRRHLLTGVATGTALLAGCGGRSSSTATPTSGTPGFDVRLENKTAGERTITLDVKRPVQWTDSNSSATGTSDRELLVRDLSLKPGEERRLDDAFSVSGKFRILAELDAENEPIFEDNTKDFRRVDTSETSRTQIEVTAWPLEDYPEFDKDIPEEFLPMYHLELELTNK
jgi:hypothetical protein